MPLHPAPLRRDVLALDLALSGRAPAVVVAPESSYLTSEGLFLQTVTDAFVQDWSGRVRRHAAVPESWRGATYSGLRTADGRVHAGSV